MKYLKLYEEFTQSEAENKKPNRNPKYKKPEYEFKEFYRTFKSYPELMKLIPSDIDKSIFKVKSSGFEDEPEWLEKHVDPPSKPDEITTEQLLDIAEKEDPRFVPFIKWCQELFESGKMEKMSINSIRDNLTSKFKNHDWDVLEKESDFLDLAELEYNKSIEAGIDDVNNKTGLVDDYPDINISKAQFWTYVKDSIKHFNKVESIGGEIPTTQFLLHDGKYYTIGGRRRMFWHFYNNIDPTVWVIEK